MKSKLADVAEQQLIEAAKLMTHEQRLRAFIELSKRMIELQRAGQASNGSQHHGLDSTTHEHR